MNATMLHDLPEEFQRKAVEKLANKVKQAAAVDCSQSFPDGSFGVQLASQLQMDFGKVLENKQLEAEKPLPVPVVEIRNSGTGKNKNHYHNHRGGAAAKRREKALELAAQGKTEEGKRKRPEEAAEKERKALMEKDHDDLLDIRL